MRTIGITHRRKQTREEQARPTKVAIGQEDGTVTEHELHVATDELDFLKGTFPVKWRKFGDGEEVAWFSEDTPEGVRPHHCKWRKIKEDEDVTTIPAGRVRQTVDRKGLPVTEVATHMPTSFDGLASGDRVAMLLGGSGDRFAGGLSRRGERIGAVVFRIPPNSLKRLRQAEGTDKDDDHLTLASLLERKLAEGGDTRPFYWLRPRDRANIRVKEHFSLRMFAMKDRIRCQQRIQQAAEGRIFLNEEGEYPEGRLEDALKQLQANDAILQGLIEEEERRAQELRAAVWAHPMWDAMFADIKGVGERLAAGFIVAVADIRRFWEDPDPVEMQAFAERRELLLRQGRFEEDVDKVRDRIGSDASHFRLIQLVRTWKREHGKEAEAAALDEALACFAERKKLRKRAGQRGMYNLRAHCGVHVLQGGKYEGTPPEKSFPRQRHGRAANWHPAARQALYLLVTEQFNRAPNSEWGQRLRHYKAQLRAAHPETVEYEIKVDGRKVTKKRYTNGHIHTMAVWRTATKFVDHVYREWSRIERQVEAAEVGAFA